MFWDAFWPGFWSNIAAGAIIGLVVGVGLWRLQLGYEQRMAKQQARQQAEIGVASLRPNLLLALDRPTTPDISSARNSMPKVATALFQIIEINPIGHWLHAVGRHDLLEKLQAFPTHYAAFLSVADSVDERLGVLARRWNSARNAIAANDPWYRKFALGRSLGFRGDELIGVIDAQPQQLANFEAAFTDFMTDPELMELLVRFRHARARLDEDCQGIRRLFDEPIN